MASALVQEKLDRLPPSPGVYVFRGSEGEALYVGKARSLRSRVRSYFQPGSSDQRYFIALLDRFLADIETFVVETEKEAALLENQLIKELQPRFNFKLRDDKEFLSLRLDGKAHWPRLEVVRRPRQDGASYFGPYHSATSARQTLRLVNRFFQLRTCTDSDFRGRTRPCLQYQIKRCLGPCVYEVPREDYLDQVRLVGLFLDGRHDELVDDLERRMTTSADAQEYERAAVYRDQIRSVQRARESQRVTDVRDTDQDVLGFFRQADQAEIAVLMVRRGRLVGVRTFPLKGVSLPDDEIVAAFVGEYYAVGAFLPDELVLPVPIEAMEGLGEVLSDRRGRKIKVVAPKRAAKARLVRMAMDNAEHAFREKARAREDIAERLAHLQKRLRLPNLPRRIECVDVSHTGGDDAVAAVVALADGSPERARYRSFTIKRAKAGDDYGAMYEVLSRRFRRGRDKEAGWDLPDLLVVDGGKGQLGAALAALRDLGVEGLPVVALAKEKETALGEKVVDRVYTPGAKNAVSVRESNPALQMLALARDEAHRASNLHRERRAKKRKLQSDLDRIDGIGPKTRQKLLSNLGSVRAVMEADEETLVSAGASTKQAQAIRDAYGPPDPEQEAVDNAFSET